VKNGQPTGAAENFRPVLSIMRKCYGHTPAVEFGPLALKAIRSSLIERGNCRGYVNDNVVRIRQMFKWAASEELIPTSVFQALATVTGLRKGRSAAKETEPVEPVDDQTVESTIAKLPAVVADMVRFQRLTGCRPGEVRILRPCDVKADGELWEYRPESHKTEHHGRDRVLFIGPRAQDILRPYLLREKTAYCFSPRDSERVRRTSMHEQRVTPLSCGNRPGTNKTRKPNRRAGDRYTKDSFCRAIHRACDRAFPPPVDLEGDELKAWRKAHRWNPNQLRHSAATEIRKHYGIEGAQVTLGHANADVTQVYAERDMTLAAKIMKEVG
jgi:integrase